MKQPSRPTFLAGLASVPLLLGAGVRIESGRYICPPCGCASDTATFDAPGSCPSCGMALVAQTGGASNASAWAGAYGDGGEITPVRLAVSGGTDAKATFDLAGFDGGYTVKSFAQRANQLSGEVEAFDRAFAFTATIRGDRADGTVTLGGRSLPLALQRIVPLDIAAARRHEGAYRVGARIILVEHVFGDILAMNEQPDGAARILFPTPGGDYVVGPTLFAPAPGSRRVRFDADARGGRMIVGEGAGAIVAHKVPLRIEPVTFTNGAVRLAGTLIAPRDAKRHPAFVFTHGSGAATRTSYSGLGYYLALHGIAALTYDKRGSGESTGDLASASFEDLADDAAAGAALLRSRRDIDPRAVGFWGLSQGSSIAPLAASRHDATAPVIAASGGGISIDRWELLAAKGQLESDGRFSSAQVAEALEFERLRDRYKRDHSGWAEYAAARASAVKQPWYAYPTTDLFGPSAPDSRGWAIEQQFFFYDPAPALRALRGPVLALLGEFDPPSSSRENVEGWRSGLSASRDATVRVLPKAGHSLFENASPNARELPRSRRFVPGLFASIAAWAQRAVRSA